MPARRNTTDDLWAGIDRRGPDECWNWTRSTNSHGYGEIRIAHKQHLCHRLAYELTTGEGPGSLLVLHSCDNRRCCNPAHLRLGTVQDNSNDMVSRQREARGERHGRARLTAERVCAIREMAANGHSFVAIARQFGVTPENVSYVVRRVTWRHVA